jgi:hypothetical protein
MPRLGLGIHEFGAADSLFAETNSWIPSLKLGMTNEYGSTVE